MAFSFLFSYKTLQNNLIVKTTSDAIISREALDRAFELCFNEKYCDVYSPSQTIDKIKNHFSPEQEARFRNVLTRESSSQGVLGYSFDSKETISKSATSLSYNGKTIVIGYDDELEKLEHNGRIVGINPTEFINSLEEAETLYEALSLEGEKDGKLIDLLVVILFKKDLREKLKMFLPETSDVGDAIETQKE